MPEGPNRLDLAATVARITAVPGQNRRRPANFRLTGSPPRCNRPSNRDWPAPRPTGRGILRRMRGGQARSGAAECGAAMPVGARKLTSAVLQGGFGGGFAMVAWLIQAWRQWRQRRAWRRAMARGPWWY
jgi:hypothetical protein